MISARCGILLGLVLVVTSTSMCTHPSAPPASVGPTPTMSQPPKPVPPAMGSVPVIADCFWTEQENGGSASGARVAEDVSKLRLVTNMPYACADLCKGGPDCGDRTFWRVVRDGLAALPSLVEALDDPTLTQVDVPMVGGKYAVGDVALVALREILRPVPDAQLAGVDEGVNAVEWFQHLRGNVEHRRRFKRNVKAWLAHNENRIIWHSLHDESAEHLQSVDCRRHCTHPAGGYYELRQAP